MYISIPLGKSRLSDENSIGLETISDIHADVTIQDCFSKERLKSKVIFIKTRTIKLSYRVANSFLMFTISLGTQHQLFDTLALALSITRPVNDKEN